MLQCFDFQFANQCSVIIIKNIAMIKPFCRRSLRSSSRSCSDKWFIINHKKRGGFAKNAGMADFWSPTEGIPAPTAQLIEWIQYTAHCYRSNFELQSSVRFWLIADCYSGNSVAPSQKALVRISRVRIARIVPRNQLFGWQFCLLILTCGEIGPIGRSHSWPMAMVSRSTGKKKVCFWTLVKRKNWNWKAKH